MKLSPALALLLAAVAAPALAQQPAPRPAAPSAAPAASAPVSPAKKALVAKVLQLQQSGYEAMGAEIVLSPALRMQQQLRPVVQSAPAEQREKLARDLESDLVKYGDEVQPIAREAARRIAPGTIGTVLEQRLTEDELKQVVAALESPGFRKFLSLDGEMRRAFAERMVAETRPQVQPKLQALETSVRGRLAAVQPAAGGAPQGNVSPSGATVPPTGGSTAPR
jgi:hypothetical protein